MKGSFRIFFCLFLLIRKEKPFFLAPAVKDNPPAFLYWLFMGQASGAVKNSDGTITAVLVRPDSQSLDRIEYTDTFILKERQNGSLYFKSGKREYINNYLVSISGDYRRFDKNRLNLKTLQLEPKIITFKAAGIHILGVLADGRTLFWYNLNPSENGVCLTKGKWRFNSL